VLGTHVDVEFGEITMTATINLYRKTSIIYCEAAFVDNGVLVFKVKGVDSLICVDEYETLPSPLDGIKYRVTGPVKIAGSDAIVKFLIKVDRKKKFQVSLGGYILKSALINTGMENGVAEM
jgi:hypothetical protein